MPIGTVSHFDEEKGFGFIETDASDEDVFFHVQDLPTSAAAEGLPLEFEIEQAEKGPRATKIFSQSIDSRAR